jgi:hypothetical protein
MFLKKTLNPTHKIETGSGNKWELLIANHLDKSLWLSNHRQGAHIIFIKLFSRSCTALLHFLPASANQTNMQEKNHCHEPNQHMLTFLHPINVQGHILSTIGDALTSISTHTWYMYICQKYHIQNDVQVISTHKREIL